ncbi:membrane lipoprotein lipid attachment site-containing protein [Marinobacter sp. ANT_B65]|uniref:membrane lipoprotein lipid attachment site-containing protein n=1 Tax=Marinobacter sp. ANT_B65 TaxID=2039467 RepID=UPI000BBE639B|nr:membrane lipoprotein lipid attachment site-containing protein [Marinobacter sp. ANT_B65]PCM46262.1 hypothetical protein CPA50_10115 [Marinobacter sp. ANT_B65]
MKNAVLVIFAALVLAGCQDRVIWDDQGKAESATENREVWDSNGKMKTGERKIWVNKDGEQVVK